MMMMMVMMVMVTMVMMMMAMMVMTTMLMVLMMMVVVTMVVVMMVMVMVMMVMMVMMMMMMMMMMIRRPESEEWGRRGGERDRWCDVVRDGWGSALLPSRRLSSRCARGSVARACDEAPASASPLAVVFLVARIPALRRRARACETRRSPAPSSHSRGPPLVLRETPPPTRLVERSMDESVRDGR